MRHDSRVKVDGQIHVGFVSYNFNNHPVSVLLSASLSQYLYLQATHLLLNLFRLADRSVVKIYAYSLNSYTDKWRKQVSVYVVFYIYSLLSLWALV